MPYARDSELPSSVRDSLSKPARDVFRAAFNAAVDSGHDEQSAFRIAWSAVSNAGWTKDSSGSWSHKTCALPVSSGLTIGMEAASSFGFDIARKDAARRIVYGWLYVCKDDTGQTVIDHSGEFVRPETLERAMEEFVLTSRVAGEMHDEIGVGHLVAAITMTDEIKVAMGIDPAAYKRVGAFVGFKVRPETWKRVESGELAGFSFGGTARRRVVEVDNA